MAAGPVEPADLTSRVVQQVLGWATLVWLLLLLTFVGWPVRVGPPVVDLSGTWPATLSSDGDRPVRIRLPGLFSSTDVPSDGLVRVDIPVDLAPVDEPQALWIDRPMYAIRVLWDGDPITTQGDPDKTGPYHRSDRSLLVPLPPHAQGPHVLTLEIRGDYGRGGVLGEILLGPLSQVRLVDWTEEAQWLGLTLGLALLAVIHLAVASLRTLRPAHLYFGLFAGVTAFFAYSHADASTLLATDALDRLRLARLTQPLLGPLCIAFATSFFDRRPGALTRGALAVGVTLGLLGVLVPSDALAGIERVQDVETVAALCVFLGIAVDALRRRVRGSRLLAMSLLPMIASAVHEVALGQGWFAGSSWLFPGLVLFVAGASAALAVAHARDAERHHRLVRNSVDAIVAVDPTGRMTDANPAAEALLEPIPRESTIPPARVRGAPPESRPGHNLLEYVEPDDRPLVRAHIARSTERPDRAEFRLVTRGKTIVVESLATPLEGGTSLLVLRDVTRRRQLDQGILQAARMETVAVLVGGIAHDFNNMLGTLLAHVGFLQATVEEDDAQQRLGRMEGTIERASLLTRRLLAVAGGTSSDLGAVSLVQVAKGAAELVEPTLPTGMTLTLDVPDDLPPVLGAVADLEHVLVNLLVNARDALGTAGHIRVVARRFQTRNNARGVVLAVEDDGPGVADALKDEIFTPFFTTKGPNRGTGLGLAVASQILRDHYGRIWVEDRPGGGARFCIALRHADTMDKAPAPMPEGRDVLLVEDEPALLDSYATALREAGYSVRACLNGTEAWRALHKGAPDILVTDVVMPGISGLELATLCRELHPEVPVLLVSGFIPEGAIPQLADGTWYRLDKPVRAARLVATVGRLLRRAERQQRGEVDITEVTYLFPPLEELKGADLGL